MSNITDFELKSKTKWTVLDIILVFIFLIILMGITTAYAPRIKEVFQGITFLGMEPKLTLFFFSAMLQSVYMISIIMIIGRYRKIRMEQTGLGSRRFMQNLLIGISGGTTLFIIVVMLGILVTVISKTIPPPQDVATFLLEMDGIGPRVLAFFLGSVMAPLSEELYFRGMVYPVFREKLGRTAAVLISGVFFSLAHRDLFRLIPIAVGGIGLALLYERTKSLWTAIIAHSTWNTIMLILMISSSRFLP